MPPEMDATKLNEISEGKTGSSICDKTEKTKANMSEIPASKRNQEMLAVEKNVDGLVPSSAPSRKQRERRNLSPSIAFIEPLSPCSSSTSGDATFEPTIDMMVNDFDDEQTLNEEEAIAALETDTQDEIETLKEESEMPIEELLAKYRFIAEASMSLPKKSKKSSKKKPKVERNHEPPESEMTAQPNGTHAEADIIVIESGDEDAMDGGEAENADDGDLTDAEAATEASATTVSGDGDAQIGVQGDKNEKVKPRSLLLDLYPEQAFSASGKSEEDPSSAFDALYGDYEVGSDGIEDETDNDYIKKTIMVGQSYQAHIPDGLSQYGDVLPYENEDKLIWEPSQVSEREVEGYLEYFLKVRDNKSSLSDDELSEVVGSDKNVPSDNIQTSSKEKLPSQSSVTDVIVLTDLETGGVVKDNEQALHLLVQCGYDFKEALRRKEINAVPPTGSMSLWSEEECQKFEEGVQKFGKDFLKIRQNQVRTRTMREIVHFYYLWKKSGRRDHDFANSDTVDHMDIYLNEGRDFGHNTASATIATIPPSFGSPQPPGGFGGVQKNFSIMSNTPSSIEPIAVITKVGGSKKRNSTAITLTESATCSK